MTKIPIAHSASDFNEEDPFSTGDDQPFIIASAMSRDAGKLRKRTPDHEFEETADEVAAMAADGHVFLTAKRCVRERACREGVSFGEFKVLTAILDGLNHKTGVTFIGQKKLRIAYGMDERGIERAFSGLFDRGIIARRPRQSIEGADEDHRSSETTVFWLLDDYQEVLEAKARRGHPVDLSGDTPGKSGRCEASPGRIGEAHPAILAGVTRHFDRHNSSLEPVEIELRRASARGGVSEWSREVQFEIRAGDTRWDGWLAKLEGNAPEAAEIAKQRGRIIVAKSRWPDTGLFVKVPEPPERRPPLRVTQPSAGAEVAA
jgi:hypothetical protein